MKWSVTSTNVLRGDRRHADNLATAEVYTFVFETTPQPAELTRRLWLDLLTTGQANFGIYKFSATASG